MPHEESLVYYVPEQYTTYDPLSEYALGGGLPVESPPVTFAFEPGTVGKTFLEVGESGEEADESYGAFHVMVAFVIALASVACLVLCLWQQLKHRLEGCLVDGPRCNGVGLAPVTSEQNATQDPNRP